MLFGVLALPVQVHAPVYASMLMVHEVFLEIFFGVSRREEILLVACGLVCGGKGPDYPCIEDYPPVGMSVRSSFLSV